MGSRVRGVLVNGQAQNGADRLAMPLRMGLVAFLALPALAISCSLRESALGP